MGKFMGKFAFCIVKICLVAQINLVCGCGLMSRDTDPGAAGADAAAGEKAAAEWQGDPVPYKTEIVVDGPKYLMDKMRGVSQLAQLERKRQTASWPWSGARARIRKPQSGCCSPNAITMARPASAWTTR